MNPFFGKRDGSFDVPRRVYARRIDGSALRYALFDSIDADWFDSLFSSLPWIPPFLKWSPIWDTAPVYAVEINSRNQTDVHAVTWLRGQLRSKPSWVEILLKPDPYGPGEVYHSIFGPPQRADASVRILEGSVLSALITLTDLTSYVAPEDDIKSSLPTANLDQVFVLDVGQGAANALLDDKGRVVAYVDLGAGVLADSGTWPTAMTGICLQHDPVVILTHWHYDHFQAANVYSNAKKRTWIAPFQTIGPGPQLAMATDIVNNGKLLVWAGYGKVAAGAIELERCIGKTSNFNRSGIAVWILGPNGADPILLPGDAGYKDVPSLSASTKITSFTAAHHGGMSPGAPPSKVRTSSSRFAFSYGGGNSYGHPLSSAIGKLSKVGWSLGSTPGGKIDERRTEHRPTGPSLPALGHILLDWPSSTRPSRACLGCGCSIDPTQ